MRALNHGEVKFIWVGLLILIGGIALWRNKRKYERRRKLVLVKLQNQANQIARSHHKQTFEVHEVEVCESLQGGIDYPWFNVFDRFEEFVDFDANTDEHSVKSCRAFCLDIEKNGRVRTYCSTGLYRSIESLKMSLMAENELSIYLHPKIEIAFADISHFPASFREWYGIKSSNGLTLLPLEPR